jgi:hypothetical protein
MLYEILNSACERGQFTFSAMLAHHWERNESSIEPSPANNSADGDSSKLVTVSIIFIILNTVFVILRCYARSLTKATYGWEDYLIFASLIFNIASCVLSIGTSTLLYSIISPVLCGINSSQCQCQFYTEN